MSGAFFDPGGLIGFAIAAERFGQSRPAKRKRPQHLEAVEQRLFVQRFRLDPATKYLTACAIPNGGKRSVREAALMKAEGVTAGAPDWVLFHQTAQHVGLALEFKSPTGKGRVSPAQAQFLDGLRQNGWAVHIVKTAAEAWDILERYLNVPGGTDA
jgi:hypothetical protein